MRSSDLFRRPRPARRLPRPHLLIGVTATLLVCPVLTPAAIAQDGTGEQSTAVTWGVAPSSQHGPDGRAAFDYQMGPGDTLVDFVGISNLGADPITVTVYASDAYTTDGGGLDLLAADTDPVDVGSWIAFNERELTIDPQGRVDVPFAVTVPDNATPGDHVGGVVAAIAERAGGESGGEFTIERRVGARVHLRVSGDLEPRLEPLLDAETYHLRWNPFRPGELTFDYTVTNAGNVRLAGTLLARVAGPWGLGERAVKVAELPQILPGDSLSGRGRLDDVWPLLRLDVDLIVRPEPVDGADTDLTIAEHRDTDVVWAPPWPQAIPLIALLLAIWIATKVIRRRRRRKRGEPEPDEHRETTEPQEAEARE